MFLAEIPPMARQESGELIFGLERSTVKIRTKGLGSALRRLIPTVKPPYPSKLSFSADLM